MELYLNSAHMSTYKRHLSALEKFFDVFAILLSFFLTICDIFPIIKRSIKNQGEKYYERL